MTEYQPILSIEMETVESIQPQYRMRQKPSLIVKGRFDRFMFAQLLCQITAEYSLEDLNEALSRENHFQIVINEPKEK